MPVEPRDSARLLVAAGSSKAQHRRVADLPDLLQPGDVVVLNDTRVLPARLSLRRASGGSIEALVLEPHADAGQRVWEVLLRPSRRIRVGELLTGGTTGQFAATVVGEPGDGRWLLRFAGDETVEQLLATYGEIPLPPYITAPLADSERYQTVYARRAASAAAPTAGLHLTDGVLARLSNRGVGVLRLELVVGLGTFRPITSERVEDHHMHAEHYRIPSETVTSIRGARSVVAVGTTVVRALESFALSGQTEGRTDIFLRRGHRFSIVDRLLTNFHVPRSSLLVLLDAFMGPRWRELYRTALTEQYRFLSLGDAMLVDRDPSLA